MSPADIVEEWIERSAIMEHDGGLSRKHADDEAWQRIGKEHDARQMARAWAEAIRRNLR